jgi:hypothetical protein
VHKKSGADDKKLQATLKKMNVQPITQIEEVNMFKSDGNVIHFSAPKGKPGCMSRTAGKIPANESQSTHQSHPTRSPSTATVRTRSSPSLSRASSTSSVRTRSPRYASWQRATRACRRVVRARTRRMTTMTRYPTLSRARTLRARAMSSKA